MRARFHLTKAMQSSRRVVAAVAYAKAGIKVFAIWGTDAHGNCDCGREDCNEAGKHPLGVLFPHGHKDATTDVEIIRKAFRKYPNANVAIVPDDALMVVDIDSPEAKQAIRELGLPRTLRVKTSRGEHLYLENPQGLTFERPKGVDIRRDGNGYVIAPPSRHASGHQYRWLPGTDEAADLVLPNTKRKAGLTVNFADTQQIIPEGDRNNRLASLAGLLRYGELGTEAIEAALVAVNDVACRPPLEQREVRRIAASIGQYESPLEEAFGTLSDVEAEEIAWLYRPYLPRGTLTMLEGDPGLGKSTFAAAIAAAVTKRSKVPWSPDRARGGVLVMSAEDDPARVLRPRLERNGADPRHIRYCRELFRLDESGLSLLRLEVERSRPELVIIDPIVAFLHAGGDLNDAADMTQFLTRIDRIAREFDCAILVVRHLRKHRDGSAINQGLGSIALSGRVRSILLLARHPHDRSLRAVAHTKSNYAKEGPTIVFSMFGDDNEHARIEWLDSDAGITAEDLLSGNAQTGPGRPTKELYEVMEFLRSYLAAGPKDSRDVELAAEARSITKATLRRAREALGIRPHREGRHTVASVKLV